jgi:hypothetical protein
MKYAR